MRILHIGKYYAPYHGGMETVLQNQVEGLLESGFQVRVLVAGEQTLESMEPLVSSSENPGLLVRTGNWGIVQSQPLTLNLYSSLRRQLADFKPDLVHLHVPNPLAVACWTMLERTQKMPPLVLWHHADITRQRVGAKILHPLMENCRRKAKGIAVSTTALLENSSELRNVRRKVCVIPFGIKDPALNNGTSTPGKAFLFIGRLVSYKGLDILLDAMAKVPSCHLDIVGTGPQLDQLRKQAQSLGISSRVKFRGPLSPAKLNSLMAQCRALVLPSINSAETFGLVQLEAMAAGRPVIASDLPTGVAEICRPGQTGLLVPPGDVDSLSQALARCLEDDDLVRGWGHQARQIFLSEYTRDRMNSLLIAWYNSMVNSNQGSLSNGE